MKEKKPIRKTPYNQKCVMIPHELWVQLGHVALEQGTSRSEIIRQAIKDYIQKHAKT
jgi:metal-responsive CopG/Arc/MetJ family transcriptional regulator